MPISPEAAHARARKAAAARWAKTPDRSQVVTQLRGALKLKWENEIDPDRVLPADVRERLALEAERAHLAKARLIRDAKVAQAKAAQTHNTSDTATQVTAEVTGPEEPAAGG